MTVYKFLTRRSLFQSVPPSVFNWSYFSRFRHKFLVCRLETDWTKFPFYFLPACKLQVVTNGPFFWNNSFKLVTFSCEIPFLFAPSPNRISNFFHVSLNQQFPLSFLPHLLLLLHVIQKFIPANLLPVFKMKNFSWPSKFWLPWRFSGKIQTKTVFERWRNKVTLGECWMIQLESVSISFLTWLLFCKFPPLETASWTHRTVAFPLRSSGEKENLFHDVVVELLNTRVHIHTSLSWTFDNFHLKFSPYLCFRDYFCASTWSFCITMIIICPFIASWNRNLILYLFPNQFVATLSATIKLIPLKILHDASWPDDDVHDLQWVVLI